MLNDHSQQAPGNGTAPPAARSANSKPPEPRTLSSDEAKHVLYDAQRRQENWGCNNYYSLDGPPDTGPAPTLDQLVKQDFLGKENIRPEQAEELLQRARTAQAKIDAQRRDAAMKALNQRIGQRFSNATLDGFKVTTPEQTKVLTAVRSYVSSIRDRVAEGRGIVLFGAAGTGKTHLLAAVAKAAIPVDLTIKWRNGQDLFADFRDAISKDEPEADIIREMVAPDVLVLDDLLPPSGKLSEYQAGNLYRIIDTRYRECRPTLVSVNVASGEEAEQGMGAQVVDRLRDGASTLFCSWPSFRRAGA